MTRLLALALARVLVRTGLRLRRRARLTAALAEVRAVAAIMKETP